MIALDVCDPTTPYNMAVTRGRVSGVTFDGVEAHIDKVAKKYLLQDKYRTRQPGVRRVLIKIEPTHVIAPFTDSPRWKAWGVQKK